MTKEIKYSDHVRPEHTQEVLESNYYSVLETYFGDQICICGFCGLHKLRGFVCDCGWDNGYSPDKVGEDGLPVHVWFKS